MKYTDLSYIEKYAELEEIGKTIKFRNLTLADFIDEHNLIFFISFDCLNQSEKAEIKTLELACFELVTELNKHFNDTTFYLTHSDIDTINEYITIADFETIRDF